MLRRNATPTVGYLKLRHKSDYSLQAIRLAKVKVEPRTLRLRCQSSTPTTLSSDLMQNKQGTMIKRVENRKFLERHKMILKKQDKNRTFY